MVPIGKVKNYINQVSDSLSCFGRFFSGPNAPWFLGGWHKISSRFTSLEYCGAGR